jgi:hypothetical protein
MKITKMQLQGIIAESTKKALNELDWKTYANAATAAKSRDKEIRKYIPYWGTSNHPSFPIKHYKEDGTFDSARYERDSYRDWERTKQYDKFQRAAHEGLSKDICGEKDFEAFLLKYLKQNGLDDKITNMIEQYAKGIQYIRNH